MRKLLVAIICVGFGVSGVSACKKKEDTAAKPGDKAGDKAGDKKTPPAAPAVKNLGDKMGGLQIEVPADATVADTSADAPNVMISSNECTVMVGTVTAAYAETMDKAVAEIEKDPNKLKAWVKKEPAEGGWYLEWTASSMMDEKRTLYGVQRRITVGDKQYDCARNSDSPEGAACVAKACMSLKKAP